MAKKDVTAKLADQIQREEVAVQKEVMEFYPDGIMADFAFVASKMAPLSEIANVKMVPQALTQEQMEEECFTIHSNVRQGMPDNIEIRLNSGVQYFNRNRYELGNTVVKLQTIDSNSPHYLYLKAGDTLDAGIFVGGDDARGFLVTKDERGNDLFARLAEFHMLSVQENTDTQKEVGLMTSYIWLTAKVFSGVLLASSLAPVKNLLLSEYLEAEWKRSRESAKTQQLSSEVTKEDANEKE